MERNSNKLKCNYKNSAHSILQTSKSNWICTVGTQTHQKIFSEKKKKYARWRKQLEFIFQREFVGMRARILFLAKKPYLTQI